MHRFLASSSSSPGETVNLCFFLYWLLIASSLQVICLFSVGVFTFFWKIEDVSSGQGRQAFAAEADVHEDAEDVEEELIPDDVEKQEASLEEVLQAEAACLRLTWKTLRLKALSLSCWRS